MSIPPAPDAGGTPPPESRIENGNAFPAPRAETPRDETLLPGVHRGGFQRLPTEPVGVTSVTAPAEPGVHDTDTGELLPVWMPAPAPAAPHRGVAGWALGFSILGLAVSLVVGWGFPIGLVGIVMAAIALRRPLESRQVAGWALALGILSVLYSAGWLLWAATRMNLLG